MFCDSFCGSAQFLKLPFYDALYLIYQLLTIGEERTNR